MPKRILESGIGVQVPFHVCVLEPRSFREYELAGGWEFSFEEWTWLAADVADTMRAGPFVTS